MVAIAASQKKLLTQSTWFQALAQPAQEFVPTALPILSGAIPSGLRGSLYRNGPARLERGGCSMGHWFDGDGAILGVHLTEAGATGVYRYVQTAGYQAESEAGTLLYGNYGMVAPGALWNRFRHGTKNAANTSVIALPDRLLALWEGGQPHALDLDTLNTQGLDNLGSLSSEQAYSAHPKRDPKTGDIFNFGVSYGKKASLHLYRSDKTGTIQRQNTVPLDHLPMIHDFVLAGPYLLFCISPLSLNPLPLMAHLKSYSDCLNWKPELGTQILVIDRNTLEVVSRSEAEPWYQWHFSNGTLNDHGLLVVDVARYPDFSTNQFLKEVASGQIKTEAPSALWQLIVNPKTGKLEEANAVLDRDCEFPVVSPNEVGQASRHTYLSLRRQDAPRTDLFGTIGRFDYQTGELTEADLGAHCYGSEPIFAPDPDHPGLGWVLTVVFDCDRNQSEVWIFDSAHLNEDPLCRLALPSVVPMGFHGTWQPR
ncbi:MAG: carotenoid oxygenase family protein [Thermosynechococcaceae cyanobacterium]